MRQLTSKQIISLLKREGFIISRTKGSHIRLIHEDGRRVTVPHHTKPLKKGTLNSILKQSKLVLK